jgi:hypothetical protein
MSSPTKWPGYPGVTLWYQDPQDWTAVFLYPGPGVCVVEIFNGGSASFDCLPYFLEQATVHQLGVEADGATGLLNITVDHAFFATYQAQNPNRIGQSGLYDGNSGAYFDNVGLTAMTGSTVPEPTSLLLLGSGLALLAKRRVRARTTTR